MLETFICSQNTNKYFEKDYLDNKDNLITFELEKLSEFVKTDEIILNLESLKKFQDMIRRKMLFLISKKQHELKIHINKVLVLQVYLKKILSLFVSCRSSFDTIHIKLTNWCIKILYFYKKHALLLQLINTIIRIKDLYSMETDLQSILLKEDFPQAISCLTICKNNSYKLKLYRCIIIIYKNLEDVLEQIEERLDYSLMKMCTNFEFKNYSKIQTAYKILNKSTVAIDQLQMHFVATIHNVSINAVAEYSTNKSSNLYCDLCKFVPSSSFIQCLMKLCGSLLNVVKSYYSIHELYNHNQVTCKCWEIIDESMINNEYISNKMNKGLLKISNEIENKVITFFEECQLEMLPFEDISKGFTGIKRYYDC
ncbi:hypothetical protein TKK_0001670 [Trichogramma kaykai]